MTDTAAALLAGQDEAWLASYLRNHPGADRELRRAHAAYEQERRAQICAADKKDGSDWRAHAWLLEHTAAAAPLTKAPEEEEVIDEDHLAPNFVITPAHLRALQEARAEQLAALEPKSPARK